MKVVVFVDTIVMIVCTYLTWEYATTGNGIAGAIAFVGAFSVLIPDPRFKGPK